MPVFENERGTYIFNSKDLCMIEHMDDIINSGMLILLPLLQEAKPEKE